MSDPATPKKAWADEKREAIAHNLFITGTELYLSSLKEPGFLIRQLIPDVGLGLLVAPHESCKSWLAYDLARACATGTPWMGRSAPAADGQELNVAIANYDQDSSELKRRCLQLGIPGERLHCHTLGISSSGEPGHTLHLPEDAQPLVEVMRHRYIRLLVVDTFRQFHQGDENDSKDMGAVMRACRAISAATRAFILIIHHNNKMGGARGSGEIEAALDVELIVKSRKVKGGAIGSIRWGKTRGWAIDGKAEYGFQLADEGVWANGTKRTIIKFTERVPGLSQAEDGLNTVVRALTAMGGAAEPTELATWIDLHDGDRALTKPEIAAAVRFGKQTGVLVKAKLPGEYQNNRRVGLAPKEGA